MADAHTKPNHDYHLVNPSPWPIIGSISAFLMAIGAIMWMKGLGIGGLKAGGVVFGAGLIGVLYVMAAWWTDVIHEAQHGDHTRVVQISHRYGMILFIASEVMFFVAWFWAFFDASLFTGEAIQYSRVEFTGGHWPPKGIEVLDPWHLPLLNTLILLTSGTTVTWAHHALLHGDRKSLKQGLILTILLGITFTCVQAYEYSHAPFGFKGSIYGSTFFMATGFHGFHVHHRDDLPDCLSDPRLCRAILAAPASRFRICRLVLAFRRRGLAVPVLLHLCLGLLGRSGRGTRGLRALQSAVTHALIGQTKSARIWTILRGELTLFRLVKVLRADEPTFQWP